METDLTDPRPSAAHKGTLTKDGSLSETATPCVGVVCFRGEDVLLIQRGTPPKKGDWSIPGGHIEPFETERQAALRELFEETGIRAKLGEKIAVIHAEFEGKTYTLHDYVAFWVSGEPRAGDDACHAEFVKPDQIEAKAMWAQTVELIALARTKIAGL